VGPDRLVALSAHRTTPVVTVYIVTSGLPLIVEDDPSVIQVQRLGIWYPATDWYTVGNRVTLTGWGGAGALQRVRYTPPPWAIRDAVLRLLPAFDLPIQAP